MIATIRGGAVLLHVQAYADACQEATGANSWGTYPGHEPEEDQATDCFVPVDDPTLGNAVAAFAIDNFDRFGLMYIIWRQRIYNPSIGRYWRPMEDRGSITQNHFDHVHHSFEATAPPGIAEGDDMTPEQAEQLLYCKNFDDNVRTLFEAFADFAPDVPGDALAKGLVGLQRVVRNGDTRGKAALDKLDTLLKQKPSSGTGGGIADADKADIIAGVLDGLAGRLKD